MSDFPDLTAAIDEVTERLFASFIVNTKYRAACRELALQVIDLAVPRILTAYAEQADADFMEPNDASNWLRAKATEYK